MIEILGEKWDPFYGFECNQIEYEYDEEPEEDFEPWYEEE